MEKNTHIVVPKKSGTGRVIANELVTKARKLKLSNKGLY